MQKENEVLIFDKYKTLNEAGRGGMGIVYKALDYKLGRIVAIKELVVSPSLKPAEKENIIQRFKRESEVSASLKHPNIVSVFDWGEFQSKHYIVMEFLTGKNLKEYINENESININDMIEIFLQIAEGLNYSHNRKIIHRDIKPANIQILENSFKAKITDFGLVKNENVTSDITQDGSMFGTLGYISPEQLINSKNVDRRTDIFSFGALMYEMLTGKLPFDGDTFPEIIYAILNKNQDSIRALNSEVPENLENIVNKAMEKDMDKRYQSCELIIKDLKACINKDEKKVIHFKNKKKQDNDNLIDTLIIPSKIDFIKKLIRGEKILIRDYFQLNQFSVGINKNTNLDDVEFSALLLSENEKLEVEENFIFFNNKYSPCGTVNIDSAENKKFFRMFEINLDNVPETISKILFVISSENDQPLSSIVPLKLEIIENFNAIEYQIDDFTTEKTAVIAEIYKHKGEWKIFASYDGYNKNLFDFLNLYAGEKIVLKWGRGAE